MAEQLFTIPVNEAFEGTSECPFCEMYKNIENSAIEFTLGPSYMEDDNREVTDRLGFCSVHIRQLYSRKNRLGLALMMNTHMNKLLRDLKSAADEGPGEKGGLFKKTTGEPPVVKMIHTVESTCFVCQRIDPVFDRYVDTFFYLWKKEPEFKNKVAASKGFCLSHYARLYEEGVKRFGKQEADNLIATLNKVFFENLERVNADTSWFIDKFDHRNADKPWNNSRDALPRAITKVNSEIVDET